MKTGIWIDGKKAVIIELNGEEHALKQLDSELEDSVYHEKSDKGTFMGAAHILDEKKFEERWKNQFRDFSKKIINSLREDGDIIIFGPAQNKDKLFDAFSEKSGLQSRVKQVFTSDKLTENQMVATVKKFFEDA